MTQKTGSFKLNLILLGRKALRVKSTIFETNSLLLSPTT